MASGDIPTWITQAAQKYGLDPARFTAQLTAESGLDPTRVNPKSGAAGIAQFTPATARGFNIDPMNPQQSIFAAAAYMRANLNRFNNDYPTALAAYNWGPGNVAKYGLQAVPPETQNYIRTVTGGGVGAKAPAMDTSTDTNTPGPVTPQTLSPSTQLALGTDRLQPVAVPAPPDDPNSLSNVLLASGKKLKQQSDLA